MKILFVCGSLEEGKDGVGDYVRKLSERLASKNIECVSIALNDKETSEFFVNEGSIPEFKTSRYFKIHKLIPDKKKGFFLHKLIHFYSPDVISIQLVIYGIHRRGWLFSFNRHIAPKIHGHVVHLMWHELWIGQLRTSSLMHRLEGFLQRKFIIDFISIVNPSLHHTSIPFYQALLERIGIKSQILPLFSNFSLERDPDFRLSDAIEEYGLEGEKLICVCFGNIFSDFPFDHWLLEAREWNLSSNRKIIFCSIGKQGGSSVIWDSWVKKTKGLDWIELKALGPKSPKEIQSAFSQSDVGICLTPLEGWGKSGSVAAMIENGLTVIGYEFGISPQNLNFKVPLTQEIICYKLSTINKWPLHFQRHISKSKIESVSTQFIEDLAKLFE
ncbi:MAG: hypothetical protein K2Q22_06900 [Cytophagales bacterium]|nr:hypothetical protein [Cytophagales bacterium]